MEQVISNWDELTTVIKPQPTYFSAEDLKALRLICKASQTFREKKKLYVGKLKYERVVWLEHSARETG